MIPIYIPTRGVVKTTYDSLPEQLRGSVRVIDDQLPISQKRQLIVDMAIKNNEPMFVMVDDDCKFTRYDNGVCTGKPATAEDFEAFYEKATRMFAQYSNLSMISDHPRAFSNGREDYTSGLSKFVLHYTDRVKTARYDRIGLFEDIDFYLQLAREGKAYIKLKGIATTNDSQDYVDISPERYEGIFRDWADNFPNVKIDWSKPSIFAGNKKVPVTVRFKYNRLATRSLYDGE
jgi:hypothetical protein